MSPAQKVEIIARVDQLREEGHGIRGACYRAGTSTATYSRWKERLAEAGGDPEVAFAPRKPTGRPRGSGAPKPDPLTEARERMEDIRRGFKAVEETTAELAKAVTKLRRLLES